MVNREEKMKQRWIMTMSLFVLIYISVGSMAEASASDEIVLNSEAAILIDKKTGKVLFEQNSEQKMYPASITKIVTGIIAIEQGNLSDIVTVSREATRVIGTRVYLLEGEKIPLKKLVQGLLINSGNDAGTAIAEHLDGSEAAFAKRMNEFLKNEIGVKNTNFTNPHGLFDEAHVTTAADMAKITQYAMKNEKFRDIVGTKELEWVGEGWETTIHNHNLLLWRYPGATGVKNGFVRRAGYTLVTSAKRGDTELIVVTLNAPSRNHAYRDTTKLFDLGFESFKTVAFTTEVVFSDLLGNEYNLFEDIFFTRKIEETITKEVSIHGYVKFKDHNKEVLAVVPLQKREEKGAVSVMALQPAVPERKNFLEALLALKQSNLQEPY